MATTFFSGLLINYISYTINPNAEIINLLSSGGNIDILSIQDESGNTALMTYLSYDNLIHLFE